MDWIIKPSSKICGEINTPPDKSITHRAIMFASIADGVSIVENYLPSEDCMCTLAAFESFGVKIEKTQKTLKIQGVGIKGLKAPNKEIYAGNSGTTVRLLSGILAGQNFSAVITGDASLSKRPMKRIIAPLGLMGVEVEAREGNYLPLKIKGNPGLKSINYKSPVASAQVKSCVLLAGLQAAGITIFEEPLKSRDHTERMLKAAGVDIQVSDFSVSLKGPSRLNPQNMVVPGDISSAAFFLIAGAVVKSSKLIVSNVGINPTRDGIIEVLKKMNARLSIVKSFEVSGEPVADFLIENSDLKSTEINADIMPRLIDEIPIIVLAATQAKGTTIISGAGELRVKESDRLKTISSQLNKMGANIEEKEDGLIIHGPVTLHGTETESFGDHRIAMTLAVAGLIAEGETKIKDVECVDTSFPGFLSKLNGLYE